jgi:hypothetical protein
MFVGSGLFLRLLFGRKLLGILSLMLKTVGLQDAGMEVEIDPVVGWLCSVRLRVGRAFLPNSTLKHANEPWQCRN